MGERSRRLKHSKVYTLLAFLFETTGGENLLIMLKINDVAAKFLHLERRGALKVVLRILGLCSLTLQWRWRAEFVVITVGEAAGCVRLGGEVRGERLRDLRAFARGGSTVGWGFNPGLGRRGFSSELPADLLIVLASEC